MDLGSGRQCRVGFGIKDPVKILTLSHTSLTLGKLSNFSEFVFAFIQ